MGYGSYGRRLEEAGIDEIREAMEVKLTEWLLTNDDLNIKLVEGIEEGQNFFLSYRTTFLFRRYDLIKIYIKKYDWRNDYYYRLEVNVSEKKVYDFTKLEGVLDFINQFRVGRDN